MRDAPDIAARVLQDLGYSVSSPPTAVAERIDKLERYKSPFER